MGAAFSVADSHRGRPVPLVRFNHWSAARESSASVAWRHGDSHECSFRSFGRDIL